VSRAIVAVRKTRKRRTCSRCQGTIERGELYEETRLPPHYGEVGNAGWLRLARHAGECQR
jgi:hypothetical protein